MSMQLISSENPLPNPGEREGGEHLGVSPAKKIAIVEDELMVAWSLQTIAEDLGHEVIGVFATGEAALEILADEPADLLFLDINLGEGIDGIETARRLRERQPISVLFISAYADPETRERAMQTVPGAILLRKPVLAGLLEQAIAQLGETRN